MTKDEIEQRRQEAKEKLAKEREREWALDVLNTIDYERY